MSPAHLSGITLEFMPASRGRHGLLLFAEHAKIPGAARVRKSFEFKSSRRGFTAVELVSGGDCQQGLRLPAAYDKIENIVRRYDARQMLFVVHHRKPQKVILSEQVDNRPRVRFGRHAADFFPGKLP